jgi:2-polyprenyl-6-methoxyphenol hydroxylase-like FAD-dependent oxidoreductase
MRLGSRAVVLGGSTAGLCAAGAVSAYFDEVVVVERDALPADAAHRRGAPQSKHPHFLLNSGRRAMNRIFPGYESALIEAGGLHMMPSMVTAHCEGVGWVPRRASTMTMVYGSRILIERVLRDKARERANITILEGASVTGIETTRGGAPDGRVIGAWIAGGASGEAGRLLEADLIVDAMGRGSSVSSWLTAAGWPEVPVHTLDANVTYTSRWFQKPADASRPASWWWQQMSLMPTNDSRPHPVEHDYLCQIFPIEGDRVIVTMGSWGQRMPRTIDEFDRAAERTRAPAFARAMRQCEPLSEVFVTRSTGNKWRRFDQLSCPPLGLLVVGDSICAFNPFYAQGMSSAARSAVLLAEMLDRTSSLDRNFFRRYLDAQRASLDVAWTLALARDQGYEHATGTEVAPWWRQRLVGRFSWSIFNLISAAAREDAVVERHFTQVFNLDESVTEMSRNPRFLYGLLRYAVRRLFGRHALPVGFDPTEDPPGRDYTHGPGCAPEPAPASASAPARMRQHEREL